MDVGASTPIVRSESGLSQDDELNHGPETLGNRGDVGYEAFCGVGVHGSILTASLRAIVNAVNRAEGAHRAAETAANAFPVG